MSDLETLHTGNEVSNSTKLFTLTDVSLHDAVLGVLSHPTVVSRLSSVTMGEQIVSGLTPQLDAQEADTSLLLIDLGHGAMRMGGSILERVLCDAGHSSHDAVPDLHQAQDVNALDKAVNTLRSRGLILAYKERSDGGLLAAVAEMALAGDVGVALNVDMLITEGDGISDSRMDAGDAKNWVSQVSARRQQLTLQALFNEEPGVVLQIRTSDRGTVMAVLREHGLYKHSHIVGKTRPATSSVSKGQGELSVWRDTQEVFNAKLGDLQQPPVTLVQ